MKLETYLRKVTKDSNEIIKFFSIRNEALKNPKYTEIAFLGTEQKIKFFDVVHLLSSEKAIPMHVGILSNGAMITNFKASKDFYLSVKKVEERVGARRKLKKILKYTSISEDNIYYNHGFNTCFCLEKKIFNFLLKLKPPLRNSFHVALVEGSLVSKKDLINKLLDQLKDSRFTVENLFLHIARIKDFSIKISGMDGKYSNYVMVDFMTSLLKPILEKSSDENIIELLNSDKTIVDIICDALMLRKFEEG